jgi:hypothetical protein
MFDSTGLAEPATLTLQRAEERVAVNFGADGTIRVTA